MSGEPPKIPKGSIVLIWFPFTDFSNKKLRPALVLCEGYLDVTVVYISGEIPSKPLQSDLLIMPGQEIHEKSIAMAINPQETDGYGPEQKWISMSRARSETSSRAKDPVSLHSTSLICSPNKFISTRSNSILLFFRNHYLQRTPPNSN